ncbi:hypothetical protein SAMN05444156_1942 [Verrucomicrobium sp. GAS474]|uniref:hypothetical protein n=1 Tax=Verrucomicrobium sp. GAS474 TaxID=1882831 RepID=UPI00087BDBCA|nr:hypothetical protein [Verrucomicrobium sp. GAS474]SDU09783.1 hypothetical protein SAMN05444156_1942 [Verrucomicrobium sp. GAS474]
MDARSLFVAGAKLLGIWFLTEAVADLLRFGIGVGPGWLIPLFFFLVGFILTFMTGAVARSVRLS